MKMALGLKDMGMLMKKIVSVLLVLAALALSLASCGNDDKPPIITTPTDTNVAGTDGPSQGADTEPAEEVYEPDPDCKFAGMVGFGASGPVYCDMLKLSARNLSKTVFFEYGFEDELIPEYMTGDGWSIVVDPTKTYKDDTDESKKNHNMMWNGGEFSVFDGDVTYNYYQFMIRVLPTEGTSVQVYFCRQSDDDYYMLSLGEEGNTKADCYHVVGGNAESVAGFKINYELSYTDWTAIGITVNIDTIDIYMGGVVKFSLYDPNFRNQYLPYDGEIIPPSISEANYGAPAENCEYIFVPEEMVIHDGKGSYSNSSNIAVNVFDMKTATFYDCDETGGTENKEELIKGIPGDGSFKTSYVGAYIPEGFTITAIRYAARSGYLGRVVNGVFQASVDGSSWIDLYKIPSQVAEGDYGVCYPEDTETVYTYLRYVSPSGNYGNIAEIEIWGNKAQ